THSRRRAWPAHAGDAAPGELVERDVGAGMVPGEAAAGRARRRRGAGAGPSRTRQRPGFRVLQLRPFRLSLALRTPVRHHKTNSCSMQIYLEMPRKPLHSNTFAQLMTYSAKGGEERGRHWASRTQGR